MADFLYSSERHLFTLNFSLFRISCVSRLGLVGNIRLFTGWLMHFKAKSKDLFLRLKNNVVKPHISSAELYSMYMSPKITRRHVFWMASILFDNFWVRELWKAVEQDLVLA